MCDAPEASSDDQSTEWVSWVVKLQGSISDLEDLAYWTTGNPVHVRKEVGGQYELLIPMSESDSDVQGALRHIGKQVVGLNAIGFLFGDGFQGVADVGIAKIDITGKKRHFFVFAQGIDSTLRIGRPTISFDGQLAVDPLKGMAKAFMEISASSNAIMDALQLVGRQSPTWSELYVAYELVEANGGINLADAGWINGKTLTLFKRTANSYAALGPCARHANSSHEPPSLPMTLGDATVHIRRLVRAWIEELQLRKISGRH